MMEKGEVFMLLNFLEPQMDVTIEIVWGTATYELRTRVDSVGFDCVYVEPFADKSMQLDFAKGQAKGMVYNLCVVNPETRKRQIWKNVKIEQVNRKDGTVRYMIRTYNFAKMSVSGERRTKDRVPVNTAGILKIDEMNLKMLVCDISADGISFYVPKGTVIPRKNMEVQFTAYSNNQEFNLTATCKKVRRVEEGEQSLIGCEIINGSRELLSYVWLKLQNK